jgi:hypothetical protein
MPIPEHDTRCHFPTRLPFPDQTPFRGQSLVLASTTTRVALGMAVRGAIFVCIWDKVRATRIARVRAWPGAGALDPLCMS